MEPSDQDTKGRTHMELFPGTSSMEEKVNQLVDGGINADTFQPGLHPEEQSTDDGSETQTFIIHISGDSHNSDSQKQTSPTRQGGSSGGREGSEDCSSIQIALPSGVACDQEFILPSGQTLSGLQQLADGQCSSVSLLQGASATGTNSINLVPSQGDSGQDDNLAISVASKVRIMTGLGTCKVETADQSESDKHSTSPNENGNRTDEVASGQSTETFCQANQSATHLTVQPGDTQQAVFSSLNARSSANVQPIILVPVEEGSLFHPVSDILSGDHAAAENDNNLNMLHASQNANNRGSGMVVVQNLDSVGLPQSPQATRINSSAGRSLLRQTCTYSSSASTVTSSGETVSSQPMHIASRDSQGNLIIIHPGSSSTCTSPQTNVAEASISAEDASDQKDTVLPSILFQVLTEDGALKNVNLKPDQSSQLGTGSTTDRKVVRVVQMPKEDVIRYRCDLCNATFNRLGNYTRHRMIHTVNTKDDYRYKCDVCDRMFLQRCDMKRHMVIHTGAYPYRCDVCDKGYIRHSDLVVHTRFHKKERAFKCEHCGKGFFQSGDLNRHVRMVHLGAKQLTCGHCNRKYSKEATLIRHMQTSHRDIILRSLGDQITPGMKQKSGQTSEGDAETLARATDDVEADMAKQDNHCNMMEMAKTKESMTINLLPNQ